MKLCLMKWFWGGRDRYKPDSWQFILADTLTTALYFLKGMTIRPFYCILSFLFPHKRDLFSPLWSPCVTHFVWTLRMNSYSHVSLITVNLDQLSGTWCELFVHVHFFLLNPFLHALLIKIQNDARTVSIFNQSMW